MDLNIVWFFLIGILFTGYIILDGFDLGIGIIHLFARTDEERRILINSIGPVWDGNEVWLVTAGGALFAAFPEAYATVFSGFYLPFMFLLFALIFRAVAIEFRSKQPMKWWRNWWDISFCLGSLFATFLIGVVLGNIIWGVPLDGNHEFAGSFRGLFHPYTILMGITAIALFMMHGTIYGLLKTEGEINRKLKSWVNKTIIFFVICYVIVTIVTLLYVPHMTGQIRAHPILSGVAILNILAIANIPREIFHQREGRAFLSSCASMILLMSLFAIGIYPYMVVSYPDISNSLTIYTAASSQKTLKIMLIMVLIGMPLVIGYTISIYWVFRGKVKLDRMSY